MFDPAILLSVEQAMPPQPPAAAIVESWVSPVGETARRVSRRLLERYDAQASVWLERIETGLAQIEAAKMPQGVTDAEIAELDEMIAEYETHAELLAINSGRLEKRIRRDVKTLFRGDPSVGAVARELGAHLIRTDRRIIEGLLNYALVLRLVRAEGSGQATGGPIFDDADALAQHLDALAA